jgi:hypothetical protein
MNTPAFQWGAKIAQLRQSWDLPHTPRHCIEHLRRTEQMHLTEEEREEFVKGVRSVK